MQQLIISYHFEDIYGYIYIYIRVYVAMNWSLPKKVGSGPHSHSEIYWGDESRLLPLRHGRLPAKFVQTGSRVLWGVGSEGIVRWICCGDELSGAIRRIKYGEIDVFFFEEFVFKSMLYYINYRSCDTSCILFSWISTWGQAEIGTRAEIHQGTKDVKQQNTSMCCPSLLAKLDYIKRFTQFCGRY